VVAASEPTSVEMSGEFLPAAAAPPTSNVISRVFGVLSSRNHPNTTMISSAFFPKRPIFVGTKQGREQTAGRPQTAACSNNEKRLLWLFNLQPKQGREQADRRPQHAVTTKNAFYGCSTCSLRGCSLVVQLAAQTGSARAASAP